MCQAVVNGPKPHLSPVQLEAVQPQGLRGREAVGARRGASQAFPEQIGDRLRPVRVWSPPEIPGTHIFPCLAARARRYSVDSVWKRLRESPSCSAAWQAVKECFRKQSSTWRMKAGACRLDNCWDFSRAYFRLVLSLRPVFSLCSAPTRYDPQCAQTWPTNGTRRSEDSVMTKDIYPSLCAAPDNSRRSPPRTSCTSDARSKEHQRNL